MLLLLLLPLLLLVSKAYEEDGLLEEEEGPEDVAETADALFEQIRSSDSVRTSHLSFQARRPIAMIAGPSITSAWSCDDGNTKGLSWGW